MHPGDALVGIMILCVFVSHSNNHHTKIGLLDFEHGLLPLSFHNLFHQVDNSSDGVVFLVVVVCTKDYSESQRGGLRTIPQCLYGSATPTHCRRKSLRHVLPYVYYGHSTTHLRWPQRASSWSLSPNIHVNARLKNNLNNIPYIVRAVYLD